jgi:RIO kinase 1
VFLHAFIPRTLDEVLHVERDVSRVQQGKTEDLLYSKLTGLSIEKEVSVSESSEESTEISSESEDLDPEQKKEQRKANKKAVKEANRERRKNKMKKKDKKGKVKRSSKE